MKAAAVCRNGSIFKVCFVLCLLRVQTTLSQLGCERTPHSVVIATNTTVSNITMECVIPPELVLSELGNDTWEWDKLASGVQTFNQRLPLTSNVSTTELGNSSYSLSVSCSQSGLYQAIYRGQNGSCVYSCSFFIEVEEIRESVLRDVFSVYRGVNLSSPLSLLFSNTSRIQSSTNGSEVLVGTCSSRFSTGLSGCILAVSEQWFKDGAILEPKGHLLYFVSEPGDVLKILSLSEETSGQYICVTTLPFELGSFVTVDVEIESFEPETSTTPSIAMATTLDGATSPPSNGVTLRTWEVGLVVGNIIVVILLVGLVSMGMVFFVTRRKTGVRDYGKRKRSGKYDKRKSKVVSKPRPRSMVQHIQMMEEETEAVDYVSLVEVPFSAILFEELLHKGTFKVVHHAVVTFPEKGMMSLPVAVKRLKDNKSELGMEELMGEAYTLRSVQDKAGSHPNFVSLAGMITFGGPTCLLLEYIPNGRLDDFLISLKDGPIPEWYVRLVRDTATIPYHKHVSNDLMSMLIQVTEGMKFLTDEGFIHRDLSTRTVLIGDRLNVKIVDPGMFHEGYYYVVTEREHVLQDMAPECLWEKRYSVWSDVWSFGILAYKVVTLESIPFPDATVNDLYDRMVGGERPQLLASFSNEMYFLLQRCWQFIAVERPTFTNILSDLRDMAEMSARHIIFKATKESGYVSDTGQVYLHPLPSYALDAPSAKKTKKAWRKSGTEQSLISSIDGTMYTRETAETIIDFPLSENEDKDNYEEYLQGEVSSWNQKESDSSSPEDKVGLDTPEDTGTRMWVESFGSKVYLHRLKTASDKVSTSGVTKKKKKKRDNSHLRVAAKSGFTNPMTAVMPAEVDSFEDETLLKGNTNTNNGNLGVPPTDEKRASDDGISSNGAHSITEDEGDKGVRNGEDTSNQSNNSRQLTDMSLEQLAQL